MSVAARRRRQWFFATLTIDPYQRGWRRCGGRVYVGESSVGGDDEIAPALLRSRLWQHVYGRGPRNLQSPELERNGSHCSTSRVDQMTTGEVACVAASSHQNSVRARLEVEDGYLRSIEPAGGGGDRKQQGPSARQHLRPDMIELAS